MKYIVTIWDADSDDPRTVEDTDHDACLKKAWDVLKCDSGPLSKSRKAPETFSDLDSRVRDAYGGEVGLEFHIH